MISMMFAAPGFRHWEYQLVHKHKEMKYKMILFPLLFQKLIGMIIDWISLF